MSTRLTKLLTTSLCFAAVGWVGALAIASDASAEERYVVIGGAPVDAYWNVVRRGAIEAGNDLNVSVDYLPQDADYVASTVRHVQTVLAQQPDGLATPIPDYDALRDPLSDVIASGTHVVVFGRNRARCLPLGRIVQLGSGRSVCGRAGWGGRNGDGSTQEGDLRQPLYLCSGSRQFDAMALRRGRAPKSWRSIRDSNRLRLPNGLRRHFRPIRMRMECSLSAQRARRQRICHAQEHGLARKYSSLHVRRG